MNVSTSIRWSKRQGASVASVALDSESERHVLTPAEAEQLGCRLIEAAKLACLGIEMDVFKP